MAAASVPRPQVLGEPPVLGLGGGGRGEHQRERASERERHTYAFNSNYCGMIDRSAAAQHMLPLLLALCMVHMLVGGVSATSQRAPRVKPNIIMLCTHADAHNLDGPVMTLRASQLPCQWEPEDSFFTTSLSLRPKLA